jgi:DNA mismatch endonuclease (patch repair protein)
VKKISRNKERDAEVHRKITALGWHCLVLWECQLKPKVREQTLTSLEYTLNHIFLQDRMVKRYGVQEEEEKQSIAAEDNL